MVQKRPEQKGRKKDGDDDDDEKQGTEAPKRHYRRAGDRGGPSQVWLVSFTDVMALMMTFFVMLFSMSNPKDETWEDFTATLNNQFNKFYGRMLNVGPQDTVSIDKIDFDRALDLNYLKALILSLLEQEKTLEGAVVITQPAHLILSLPEDLLFAPGQTEIKESGNQALYALANSLSRIKNKIEIVGHADPRPVSAGSPYPSNWELSLARAAAAGAVLQNVGYDKDVLIRGMSSGRYADLPKDMAEAERLSLSRRVDIVIMNYSGRSGNALKWK